MAAVLVAGAFLNGFINTVFERLLTTDAVNFVLGKKLGSDLIQRLKTALLGAEALVADAEMKQFGNPSVMKWLDNLRDAVYCAEDLLDTVLIKATTQKKESSCCSLSFFINRHRDDMVDKMEGVVRRIEDLGKQKDFLRLEKIPTGSSSWRTPTSSIVRGNVSKLHNLISQVKSLRTLLLFGYCSSSNCNIEAATWDILSKFKYLRALSFCKCGVASWYVRSLSLSILVVPDSIKELVHLCYLDLSWTNIETLPESLCKLSNLQTLKLYHYSNLTMLPSGLHNLLKLRHLDIRKAAFEEMPRKISELKELHVLSSFVVGKHEDSGIQELGGLENLHGPLEIKKLENIVDVEQAESAKIMDKKHIDELWLEWSSGEDMVSDTQREKVMLDTLQPQNGLKELKIKGYKGTIFPDWLG
ncbi:hypothetical protein Ahy_A02g009206 [Arachis hypogaea]|uniref:Uncharacterized protein n=1 Tax=Arachis hypogaea TaxID=3818 RepID=A0A445EGC5_ARAHY|nr:hypothetical protein Ahy_A02g009206 [Arachis hypogaea]